MVGKYREILSSYLRLCRATKNLEELDEYYYTARGAYVLALALEDSDEVRGLWLDFQHKFIKIKEAR